MQTQKSQEIRNVLQNPVDPEPMLTCFLWATPSWFNRAKSLFGVKKSLHRFTQFTRACPPMDAAAVVVAPPRRRRIVLVAINGCLAIMQAHAVPMVLRAAHQTP
jgi:hypothetical protein